MEYFMITIIQLLIPHTCIFTFLYLVKFNFVKYRGVVVWSIRPYDFVCLSCDKSFLIFTPKMWKYKPYFWSNPSRRFKTIFLASLIFAFSMLWQSWHRLSVDLLGFRIFPFWIKKLLNVSQDPVESWLLMIERNDVFSSLFLVLLLVLSVE